MMKKNLSLLALVLLLVCLVGFVFNQIVPNRALHAAGEMHPVTSSAGPFEKESVPLTRSAQPIVSVVMGLICVLFGILAAVPLLVDDPALRRKAGIYLGGTGFSDEPDRETRSTGRLGYQPYLLSGGEQQPMAIAPQRFNERAILLADEIEDGLVE